MRTLLMGVVGSTAYGLATEASDVDLLGVGIAGTRDVLGLDGAAVVARSEVTVKPDTTLHELGKFCSLALKCNPSVTELLWLPGYRVETEGGRRLRALREAFLSEDAVRGAYGGYAIQQARRLTARHASGTRGFSSDTAKRTAKHGRHCMRLLRQGRELLATGRLVLDMTDQRDEIFAAGHLAETDPVAFEALFAREKAVFDAVTPVLPGRPDRDAVDALVVDLRLAALRD